MRELKISFKEIITKNAKKIKGKNICYVYVPGHWDGKEVIIILADEKRNL